MRCHTLHRFSVALLLTLLMQPSGLLRAENKGNEERDAVKKHHIDHERRMPRSELIRHLREKVKYVFVLYQENRSFDSYFGTYPDAEGLFSHPAAQTPGFTQQLVNTDGSLTTIQPFRIGPKDVCPNSKVNGVISPSGTCYAADTDDIDHSHPRIVAKMDVQNGAPQMDKFAVTEELKYSPTGNPSLKAKQFGELAMAYEDCDTVPLLWRYADRFVLFDHIFQTLTGPSTPGNLAIIGAQNGQTQWALHPEQGYTDNGSSLAGVPVLNDRDPFWGSQSDTTTGPARMPVTQYAGCPSTNPHCSPSPGTATPQLNLTFATIPLTMAGRKLKEVVESDANPSEDLADVQDDVEFVSKLKQKRVPFGWYEEGYDKEPTDPGPVDASGTHASYITHHNGPQYFGYISNNAEMRSQLHGLEDFFDAIEQNTLPKEGGVFFVKGGFQNIFGLAPVDPDATVQKNFLGDDDHPAYSDAQISEAMVAEAVNKIAASRYWKHSAIIITWDDSEGDYDHVLPPLRNYGPDQSLVSNGPRVPFLLISPYARTHHIARAQGSQSSVVKFVDVLFNLPPLALLPDELGARKLGEIDGHKDLGPEDALTEGITDLLGAFSPSRLKGDREPLPASYVTIPDSLITNLPESSHYGCSDLGITTTDRQQGITNTVPSDFNPRPSTNAN
jgi:phospholipase C